MKIRMSEERRRIPSLLVLSLAALAASALATFLFGELMLPVAAAFLAAVFLLETGGARIFGIICPVAILAVDFVARGLFSYVGLEICVLALVLAVVTAGGGRKCDAALAAVLTVVIFFIVAMIMAAFAAKGSLTYEGFLDYYIDISNELKAVFVDTVGAALEKQPNNTVPPSVIASLYDTTVAMLPSVAVIIAFLIAGISLKLLRRLIMLYGDGDTEEQLEGWRFFLPRPLYWAFWILAVFSFLLGSEGVFPIIVSNLFNILSVVFAYLGYQVVLVFLGERFRSVALARLAVVAAFLLLGSLAIDVLAFLGAFLTTDDRGFGEENEK